MDIVRPTTTTEVRALIGMVHYYRCIWQIRYYVIDPLIESDSGPKGRKILCNNKLEYSFKDLKHMIYADTFLNCTDCTVPFTVHIDNSDKNWVLLTAKIKPLIYSIGYQARLIITTLQQSRKFSPHRNFQSISKEYSLATK